MIFDSICFNVKSKRILKSVYLNAKEGNITGIFGRNGSGKSTLFNIGSGLILPSTGMVYINGEPFRKKSLMLRSREISYLFQETFLPKDLKVKDFVSKLPASEYIEQNPGPLSDLQKVRISSLSGGELRYLELVLILSLDRQYILLDEPFTGVEPIIIEEMIKLIIKERDKGKGLLITDHYYFYTSKIADTAYFLEEGQCTLLDSNKKLDQELQKKGYIGKLK